MKQYQLLLGKSEETLKTVPDRSVHLVVTSPPYYRLRDYHDPEQLGQEKTPEEYIERLLLVTNQLYRVLRDDGSFWLNIGDTYAKEDYPNGVRAGEMIGIPWMVAFALRKQGWRLKSDVIWAKPNPITTGVNRPIPSHEYLFLLTKSDDFFYDREAVKEQSVELRPDGSPGQRYKRDVWTIPVAREKGSHFAVFPKELALTCIRASTSHRGCCEKCGANFGRKIEKVRYATRPGKNNKIDETGLSHRDKGRHLIETKTVGWEPTCSCGAPDKPCTVLDCFNGSGTTGFQALSQGRHYIGCDTNAEYLDMTRQKFAPFDQADMFKKMYQEIKDANQQ